MSKRKRANDSNFAADEIAAKRALLELWLGRFEDAGKRHRLEREKIKQGSIPDLRMPYPTRDMLAVLVNGIEAALRGNSDPFGIRPAPGIKLKSHRSKADRIEAIKEVASRAKSIGKLTGDKGALAKIANERHISVGTLRKDYYDKRLRQLAGLKVCPSWQESFSRISVGIEGKT